MSERYTQRDAQLAMERLAVALRKPYASGEIVMRPKSDPKEGYEYAGKLWLRIGAGQTSFLVAYIGAWHIDYNPIYGGVVIHVMSNEHGGVGNPFGSTRHTPRAFCELVWFALDALAIKEGVK